MVTERVATEVPKLQVNNQVKIEEVSCEEWQLAYTKKSRKHRVKWLEIVPPLGHLQGILNENFLLKLLWIR